MRHASEERLETPPFKAAIVSASTWHQRSGTESRQTRVNRTRGSVLSSVPLKRARPEKVTDRLDFSKTVAALFITAMGDTGVDEAEWLA